MTDRDFLMWMHERLVHVHGENPRVDYMNKLRAIIKATDKDQVTPNVISTSDLEKLLAELDAVPLRG